MRLISLNFDLRYIFYYYNLVWLLLESSWCAFRSRKLNVPQGEERENPKRQEDKVGERHRSVELKFQSQNDWDNNYQMKYFKWCDEFIFDVMLFTHPNYNTFYFNVFLFLLAIILMHFSLNGFNRNRSTQIKFKILTKSSIH